jgi:ADP-ribosyl-[dinitrogen reductase] hydrolase
MTMLGSIIGDIVGSVLEFKPVKSTEFPLFTPASTYTDDTVLTIAVADAFMEGLDPAATIKEYARADPDRGYGGRFRQWIKSESNAPYNSFGNGSAMRVSPVGFACESADEVLAKAQWSAAVTHNHPEGIKGAQAVALAIFLARKGSDKEYIRKEISTRFNYDLSRTLDQIRPGYAFSETCQGSVPESIIAFLESYDFESCIRNAISLGGDADTQACIAGGIAEAFYKNIPAKLITRSRSKLPAHYLAVIDRFYGRFVN